MWWGGRWEMIGVGSVRDVLVMKRVRRVISRAITSSIFVFLLAAVLGGDLRSDGSNYGRFDSFMM